MRVREAQVRGEWDGGEARGPANCQPARGAEQVSSQPWVTAISRATLREANVLPTRTTRLGASWPVERWTVKDAQKRPEPVGCVAGETTYLPMEIAVFEIWFIQDRRLELTCVSIGKAVGCALQTNWATQRRKIDRP